MSTDPVEDQVQEMIGRIPDALAGARRSMSIRQLAAALDYYTNTPWAIVFAVERLELRGVIRRDLSRRDRSPWRWSLSPVALDQAPL